MGLLKNTTSKLSILKKNPSRTLTTFVKWSKLSRNLGPLSRVSLGKMRRPHTIAGEAERSIPPTDRTTLTEVRPRGDVWPAFSGFRAKQATCNRPSNRLFAKEGQRDEGRKAGVGMSVRVRASAGPSNLVSAIERESLKSKVHAEGRGNGEVRVA